MTIRELFQEFVIAKRKSRSAFNAAMTQTWYGAALPLQKKLKPLKAYLLKDGPKEQTPAAMKSVLHVLAGQYGGKVRTVKG